jgi:hypothetical protein
MSSIQQQLDALREEKESLDCRIAELEDKMRWEKEQEARCEQIQHKEDLENIARLRTEALLVTSNPALVKLLDGMTTWGGGTPHSQGRAWAHCEDSLISMLNVNNGISMPVLRGETWPGGVFSMSGVFSHSRRESDGPSGINYPKGAMIDFDLVYRNGIRGLRKGLMLKEGAILQLVPEKKVYTSLGAWIVDLAQPAFGAVRVRLPDPRTRHEKAQEEVSKLGSFEQKIAWLLAHYKLKQFTRFNPSPKMNYEYAANGYEQEKKRVKKYLAELNLEASGAPRELQKYGRWLKYAADHKERTFQYMNTLSEEAKNKRYVSIFNRWKSFLFIKDAQYGRCVVAAVTDGVYHQGLGGGCKWVPQGPTQVFLSWRGQEIAFNV